MAGDELDAVVRHAAPPIAGFGPRDGPFSVDLPAQLTVLVARHDHAVVLTNAGHAAGCSGDHFASEGGPVRGPDDLGVEAVVLASEDRDIAIGEHATRFVSSIDRRRKGRNMGGTASSR